MDKNLCMSGLQSYERCSRHLFCSLEKNLPWFAPELDQTKSPRAQKVIFIFIRIIYVTRHLNLFMKLSFFFGFTVSSKMIKTWYIETCFWCLALGRHCGSAKLLAGTLANFVKLYLSLFCVFSLPTKVRGLRDGARSLLCLQSIHLTAQRRIWMA